MTVPGLLLTEGFLEGADALFEELRTSVVWEDRVKTRRTASFGEPFNYSGITYPRTAMHPLMVPVCAQLEKGLGYRPNNCLLNFYVSGKSTMGFHFDATDDLEPGSGVAIVSLGAQRTITFRRKDDKSVSYEYPLKGGSLLFMPNEVQDSWLHAVRGQPGAGPRISLTFRQLA